MQPRTWSLNGLAVELGRDRRTLAKTIAEERVPVAGRKNGHPRYKLRDVLRALERPRRPRNAEGLAEGTDRTDLLAQCRIPRLALFPWHPEAAGELRRRGLLLTVPEYAEREGLEEGGPGDDVLDWIIYGLPTCPPLPGERYAQVSLLHARLWRLGIGGIIKACGGDAINGEVGAEMRALLRSDAASTAGSPLSVPGE